MSLIKHCSKCGKQIHKKSEMDLCSDCLAEGCEVTKECSFCKQTDCVAWGNTYFETIGKSIFVDFRADMEFNQIDCQFGILGEDGMSTESYFSDFAIDINYCPICGKKLESTAFTDDYEVVGNERVYK